MPSACGTTGADRHVVFLQQVNAERDGRTVSYRNPNIAQRLRRNIKAAALLERIQAFAMGWADPHRPSKLIIDPETGEERLERCKKDDPDAIPCHMTAQQLRAAMNLVGKILPDLKAIEHTPGQPKALEELSREQLQQIAAGIMPDDIDGVTLN